MIQHFIAMLFERKIGKSAQSCTSLLISNLPRLLQLPMQAAIIAMSVLSVFSLANFASGATPQAISEIKETVIHVLPAGSGENESNTPCDPISDVYMKDLLVRDLRGNAITETKVGSQVVIEANVVNNCENDNKPLLALFEVRNSDGITVYLSWQNGIISSNQQTIVGSSWVATDAPGEYDVRGFGIGCLNCPQILSNILTYKLTVLPADT